MRQFDDAFDWNPVRRAMQNRVNATSLRDLARELDGMSPSGLQHFLDGTVPRSKGPVFMQWYLREGRRWLAGTETLLSTAIDVVVAHAALERRDELRLYLEHATAPDFVAL